MTFLARHHFERYQRAKMSHFLKQYRYPPDVQIFPAIWAISSRDYLPNWASFRGQMGWPGFPKILENSEK